MPVSDSRDEVTRLYNAAHEAKQKAKAMKARLDEKDRATAAKRAAEDREAIRRADAARVAIAKRQLDYRVRKALIAAANEMKKNGVIFKGPESSLDSRLSMARFPVVDLKDNKVVQIYINATGFEWD